jgi:hypothetical protein
LLKFPVKARETFLQAQQFTRQLRERVKQRVKLRLGQASEQGELPWIVDRESENGD